MARDVEERLRAQLGRYNKTKLRRQDYPPASMAAACQRAERLDASVAGGEIPQGSTTRVYLLLRAIVAKAAPQQLPAELSCLLPPGRE